MFIIALPDEDFLLAACPQQYRWSLPSDLKMLTLPSSAPPTTCLLLLLLLLTTTTTTTGRSNELGAEQHARGGAIVINGADTLGEGVL